MVTRLSFQLKLALGNIPVIVLDEVDRVTGVNVLNETIPFLPCLGCEELLIR
jgi:hypothetical protein